MLTSFSCPSGVPNQLTFRQIGGEILLLSGAKYPLWLVPNSCGMTTPIPIGLIQPETYSPMDRPGKPLGASAGQEQVSTTLFSLTDLFQDTLEIHVVILFKISDHPMYGGPMPSIVYDLYGGVQLFDDP